MRAKTGLRHSMVEKSSSCTHINKFARAQHVSATSAMAFCGCFFGADACLCPATASARAADFVRRQHKSAFERCFGRCGQGCWCVSGIFVRRTHKASSGRGLGEHFVASSGRGLGEHFVSTGFSVCNELGPKRCRCVPGAAPQHGAEAAGRWSGLCA